MEKKINIQYLIYQYIIFFHQLNMAPKDKKEKKKFVTHKPKIAHKLAKYVRANPVHLQSSPTLPSITHLTYGGPRRAKISNRQNTWYPADDETTHFVRKRLAPRPQAASKTLTPGRVLILLAGRFRGRRVVLLKHLASGLLLVTGPHKINGIALRRVNPAYVIATSTHVDLHGVNTQNIDDSYFARVVPKGKRSEGNFKHGARQLTEAQVEEQKNRSIRNKQTQKHVDQAILQHVKKVPFLRKYLSSRFTLYNNTRPHELVF